MRRSTVVGLQADHSQEPSMFHVPAHKQSTATLAAHAARFTTTRAVRLSFVRITDCSYPRYNVYADRMYVGMVRKARSGWVAEGDSGTFAYDVTRRDAALTMAHREQGAA
jgi:hypothetical protein